MKLEHVEPGDIIKASIKGRTGIWGEVTEVKSGTVYLRPLCPATGWRHASAREVAGQIEPVDACAPQREAATGDRPNFVAVSPW